MTTFSPVANRQAKREEIERDVEAFLRAGKEINKVPTNTWGVPVAAQLPHGDAMRKALESEIGARDKP